MGFDSCTPVELITDGTPITYGVVQPGPEDKNGVLFIRGGDISDGRIKISSLRTISRELSHQYKRTLLKGGELVISLVGNPGEVAIVPDALKGANIARQVGLVRVDQNRFYPKFVQYYLMSPAGKAQLFSYSLGSVQSVINLKELRRVEIPNFPLNNQEKIVKCLGEIDDKIDLNRCINQTLEAMAQAIFKSWFVDFDPVKAKIAAIEQGQDPLRAAMRTISGKTDAELDQIPREHHDQLAATAALFPDAMEESELGEIPKGWEVVSLYETADYLNGAAFRASDFSEAEEALPIIKIAELKQGVNSGTRRTLKEIDPKYQIKSGDVLYSWSGSPDTSLEVFRWFGATGLLNQHIFKLSFSQSGQREYTYYLLKEIKPILVATAKQKQTTGLGHITVADMKRIKVARPRIVDLKHFTQQLNRIYAATSEYEQQVMTLAALRDTLLPKLLSGELAVVDVEVPA